MSSPPPSSPSPPPPPPPPSSTMASSFNSNSNNNNNNDDYSSDDISLILRQLLQHSPPQPNPLPHPPFSTSNSPFLNDPLPAGNLTSSSADDSPTLGSSVQLKSADNDADEYDCDSDEEAQRSKHNTTPRNSSKRARAAEVHNMSEKRRRSRINEKMKALQNLIPNSNKTDKASMLDEAIEYLKQLQLQVQMLSMRNGLMLHPMCLPGLPGVLDPVQLSQMGLNFSDRDGSLDANIAHTLPSVPSHQCDPSTRPVLDTFPATITAEAPPFSLQSSMADQLSSFHLPSSSQNICSREDSMLQHQLESTVPMHTAVGNFNSQGVLHSSNTSQIHLISSNLDGLNPGTTVYDEV